MGNNSFNAGCDNLYFAARALWPLRDVLPRNVIKFRTKVVYLYACVFGTVQHKLAT